MTKTLLAATLCLLPGLGWAQAAPTAAPEPLAWLGWMKDLAGSCWEGRDPDGRLTDRQCYELQFGRFLRGTIEIGAIDNKPAGFRGDSLFHRDRRTGGIAIVLWANNGSVSLAEAVIDGEAIRFPQARAEGRPEARTSWTRQGPEAFTVTREHREGDAWTQTLAVRYRRVPK